jgi:putative PIN family toxin of toxin-antitoxin system
VIRALLDANVLASGFAGFRDRSSTPGEVVRRWQRRTFEVVVSEHLIAEVLGTLREAYFRRQVSSAQSSRAAALLRFRAIPTAIIAEVHGVATHPEDDLILATAVSAKADYLVTGDTKLLGLESYEGVRIVSPRAFLDRLESQAGE